MKDIDYPKNKNHEKYNLDIVFTLLIEGCIGIHLTKGSIKISNSILGIWKDSEGVLLEVKKKGDFLAEIHTFEEDSDGPTKLTIHKIGKHKFASFLEQDGFGYTLYLEKIQKKKIVFREFSFTSDKINMDDFNEYPSHIKEVAFINEVKENGVKLSNQLHTFEKVYKPVK